MPSGIWKTFEILCFEPESRNSDKRFALTRPSLPRNSCASLAVALSFVRITTLAARAADILRLPNAIVHAHR